MLASFLGVTSACGKRRPPLPPAERVSQTATIGGIQLGNEIRLSWKMPARNASDGSILNISRVDVYRLAEPLSSSLTLTEEEFASRSTLIGSVPVGDQDFALKEIGYIDRLRFTGQQVRLRYAVRFVNAEGQKAAFSNFLLFEPTTRVAFPASEVKAEVSQDAVRISWTAPSANIDGSTPVNVAGFNIYRVDGSSSPRLLNDAGPVGDSSFDDEFFDFEKTYRYFVRVVSLGNDAVPIESLDSPIVSVTPKDIFAPSPPESLTIAAAPGVISIFWPSNPEQDVAGYKVFRSEDATQPPDEWSDLTPDPIPVTTFQDKRVGEGRTYYYYVIAIDGNGNKSGPSRTVSDKAL